MSGRERNSEQQPEAVPRDAGTGRRLFRHLYRRKAKNTSLDRYVTGMPSLQNAIDLLPGWIGAMPPDTGLVAGGPALYADTRIAWLLQRCFDVAGRDVLELGPLEGSHTYMLHEAGAATIDAVEANALAYMRCLVAKEALGLLRARFLLGDFLPWLEAGERCYDLVVASGVLYHSARPARLLELICGRADAVFLWTHYFDEGAMPKGDPRRKPFTGRVEEHRCGGVTLRLHERTYRKAWRDPKFCGGTHDRHFWLERDGILAVLASLGFGHVVVADDQRDHHYGPSFSLYASREPPPATC